MTHTMKNINIIKANIKESLTKSGILLFLAGFMIFMGIITCEIVYKNPFNTRDNYISELGVAVKAETDVVQMSPVIFNLTMIVSGLMIIIATFFVQGIFKRYLSSIPLGLLGAGITGVGIFPGNMAPWHGIFALVIFVSGGVGAITSFRIVNSPLRYAFICLGVIALVFLVFYKLFIPSLGVGGTERWLFYPIVFWITGLGTYILGIKDGHKNTLATN
jgi:hypothetical membrane protein